MKKLMRQVCLFLLFVFCFQGLCASGVSVGNGKYVLAIEHAGKWYAMGADTYAKEVKVLPNGSALLSFPDAMIIWSLKSNGKGTFFLETENGSSLKYTGSGADLCVEKRSVYDEEPYSWSIELQADGFYFVEMKLPSGIRRLTYNFKKGYFKNYDAGTSFMDFPHRFCLFPIFAVDLSTQFITLESGVPWNAASIAGLDFSKVTGVDFRKITLPVNLTLPTNCNPNCLFYVNQGDVLPAEFKNVVQVAIDGTASAGDIVLIDGFDFYARMPFSAKSISYRRHLFRGWSTLVLPFDYPLAGEQCESYVGATVGTIEFSTVQDKLVANTPYIIYKQTDEDVTFYVAGVSIPATSTQKTEFIGNFLTFTLAKDVGLYMMNSDGTAFVHSDGTATVGSFRGYLDLKNGLKGASVRRIVHNSQASLEGDELPLGIFICDGHLRIISAVSRTLGVYSVTGQLVSCLHLNVGVNEFDLSLKGIYIINNQKIYF